MKRDRRYLKSRFLKGSRPSQQDFHDLIDSCFNHLDDAFEQEGLTLYDPKRTYNSNETCIYNGGIYLCLEDRVTGPFNPDKWELITEIPPIFLFPRWENHVVYELNNVVRYKGIVYCSKANNNQGNIPADKKWWDEIICTKQHLVNWRPGIYFNEQKVIYNNNIYQVICNNYVLSKNFESDLNAGIFQPIPLLRKFVKDIDIISETTVYSISHNYVITLSEDFILQKGENVILSDDSEFFEATIFDAYLPPYKYRLQEKLLKNFNKLYTQSNYYEIVYISIDRRLFIINGEVIFNFNFIQVKDADENDGFYTIKNVEYDRDHTYIFVNETIVSDQIKGYVINYSKTCNIYEIDKLAGCLIETSKVHEIEYAENKYIYFEGRWFRLLRVYQVNDEILHLIIEENTLPVKQSYTSLLYGNTVRISHHLNTYHYSFNILYNGETILNLLFLTNLIVRNIDQNSILIDFLKPQPDISKHCTIVLIG